MDDDLSHGHHQRLEEGRGLGKLVFCPGAGVQASLNCARVVGVGIHGCKDSVLSHIGYKGSFISITADGDALDSWMGMVVGEPVEL